MSTFDDNFPAKGNPKMSDRLFGFDSEGQKNAGMTNQALYDLFKGNLEGEFPTRESILPAFDLDDIRVMTSTAPDGKLVKSNVLDPSTGDYVTFREIDYVPTEIDGVIYAQSEGKVFGRVDFLREKVIDSKWLSIDNSGLTNVSSVINRYSKIGNIRLDDGVYMGNFEVDSGALIGSRNTILKSAPGQDQLVVNLLNGGGIENISIDGDGYAAKGIAVRESGKANLVQNIKIENLHGFNTDSYGLRVYSSSIEKTVTISNCVFKNITADADEVVGNLTGSSRGLVIGGGKLKTRVENCYFDEVGSFEDGDQIVVAAEEFPDGSWGYADCIIDGNTFNNVKKRGIKVMASGVRIINNKAFSNYTDADECPQAAFESYGNDTYIGFNEVRFARGLAGVSFREAANIRIIGNDIEVDKLGTYNTQSTRGATSYAIRGYYTSSTNRKSTGCIKLNTLDASRGVFLQNCEDFEITADNTIYGTVSVNVLCKNITIARNIFRDFRSTYKPPQRITIGDVENAYVHHNTGYGGVNGIGLGNASNTIAKNWHIFNNKWFDLTGSEYSNILTDESELYLYDNFLHYDYIGDVFGSTSAADVLNIEKDGIYVFNAQLNNLPDAARFGGASWYRIEQKSVFNNTSGVDKQLTATVIDSGANTNYPFLRWYRNKRNGVWGNWSLELSEETLPITFASLYHTLFPIQTIDTAQHTFQSIATERYTVFTGGAGNAVVTASRFVTNKELNGEVQGGAKTFIPTAGMTLRGSNLIAQDGQRFSVKFYSPTDALVTVYSARSASSSDTATVASGATPTKAEFDALLNELRDLKTKMRTAGLLAT